MLVGRRAELVAIVGVLDALAAGQPGVLVITGEAGIGKSRLIAEASDRAEQRHALALGGRASEFERDMPFGVFVDALDDYLGTLNPRRLESLGGDVRRELGLVFPALGDEGDGGMALPSERFRTHRAVRLLLDSLAASAPVMLALDDLHWADDASLELLSHLLRKRSGAPLLFVLAYRHRQQPRLLSAALSTAERDGGLTRVEPPPLTAEEAAELVPAESPLDATARRELYLISGGNPFYFEQLHRAKSVRTVRDAATVALAGPAPAPGEIPPAVAAAIVDEVEAVSPGARQLLHGAAVVGTGARHDPGVRVVAATAGMTEQQATQYLDELLAADLLRPTDVPMRFRFRHPIVLHAVYESAGAGWRIGAHARAAAALAETGAAAAMRAHHVERSAEVGDEDAIAVLAEAGHAAAGRAPATAARWFQAALRLLPTAADNDGRRLELLVPLATALGAGGELNEARDALDEVLALLPPGLPEIRARLTTLRAHVDNLRGNHGAAHALLVKELALVREGQPLIETDLHLALASDRFFAGDWEGMWEWAQPALRVARSHGDRPLHAAAAAHTAGAAYLTERLDDCTALIDEAAVLVDELSDDEIAQRIAALHWLGWCEEFVCRYEQSVAHLQRGLDVSRANGQGHLLVGLLTAQASSLSWLGRLDDALEAADTAVETSLLAKNDQFLTWSLTARSAVLLVRGDVREAIRAGEQAADLSRGDPVSALAGCAHGAALIEGGEPAAGRDAIVASAGGAAMPLIERPFRTHYLEPLVRAEIALGDLQAAAGWVELADDAAASCPQLGARQSEALRARGELLLAGGDPAGAVDRALAGAAAADQGDIPIEAARARALAGRALAVAGDAAGAAALLEVAISVLGPMGARRYCDAATRELRRLGRRSAAGVSRKRARAAAAGGALSPREREIAELVTVGKTNRQIAAELFLSEKTVETHLSHVFAKLGVSSRAAVAAELAGAKARQPA